MCTRDRMLITMRKIVVECVIVGRKEWDDLFVRPAETVLAKIVVKF
jgi:hypothetical protein